MKRSLTLLASNRYHHWCLLLFCFASVPAFFSCSDQGNNIFMSGAKTIKCKEPMSTELITPSSVLKSEGTVGMTGVFEIVDSVILITVKDSDYYLRALSTDNGRIISHLALLGRGPGEDSYFLRSRKRKDEGKQVVDMLGGQSKQLISFDAEESISQGKLIINEQTKLPPFTFNAYNLVDTVIANVYFDKDLISMKYYPKERPDSCTRVLCYLGSGDYLTGLQPLFNSMQRLRPDGHKMALAMTFFDKINVLDIHGSNHFSITTAKQIEKDEDVVSRYSDKVKTEGLGKWRAYLDVATTDECIYALHLCSDIDGEAPPSIQVFNWEGKWIKEYVINEPISRMLIDDKGERVYGFCYPEECIYVYDLTKNVDIKN